MHKEGNLLRVAQSQIHLNLEPTCLAATLYCFCIGISMHVNVCLCTLYVIVFQKAVKHLMPLVRGTARAELGLVLFIIPRLPF